MMEFVKPVVAVVVTLVAVIVIMRYAEAQFNPEMVEAIIEFNKAMRELKGVDI